MMIDHKKEEWLGASHESAQRVVGRTSAHAGVNVSSPNERAESGTSEPPRQQVIQAGENFQETRWQQEECDKDASSPVLTAKSLAGASTQSHIACLGS